MLSSKSTDGAYIYIYTKKRPFVEGKHRTILFTQQKMASMLASCPKKVGES